MRVQGSVGRALGHLSGLRVAVRYLVRSHRFTRLCRTCGKRRAYDFVICHDTTSVAGALAAAGDRPDRILLDVTEAPHLSERTTDMFRKMPANMRRAIEARGDALIRRAADISTSSPVFADELRADHGRQAMVLLNYRQGEVPRPSPGLPNVFRTLPKDSVKIAWPSTITPLTGAETALQALRQAPPDWHVIVCGPKQPGVSHPRLHFTGYLPRKEYLAAIAACQLGWVLFQPRYRNLDACVPNRLLDLISAGVPVAATDTSASRVMSAHAPGMRLVRAGDVSALLDISQDIVANGPMAESLPDLEGALGSTTPVELARRIIDQSGCIAPRVAFVAFRGLRGRNRLSLIARALMSEGATLDIICRHPGPDDRAAILTAGGEIWTLGHRQQVAGPPLPRRKGANTISTGREGDPVRQGAATAGSR